MPDLDTLSVLTRAIKQQHAVTIKYCSFTSGFTQREMLPHSLVNNGLRWHIRAFDRRRDRFSDFVITRITNPRFVLDSEVKESETIQEDNQWNRIVELEIVPHPSLKNTKPVEVDYKLDNGVLHVNVRAAVAGYLLRRWNIDCTEDGSLRGSEFHLWLRNCQALYGVKSRVMAPGIEK